MERNGISDRHAAILASLSASSLPEMRMWLGHRQKEIEASGLVVDAISVAMGRNWKGRMRYLSSLLKSLKIVNLPDRYLRISFSPVPMQSAQLRVEQKSVEYSGRTADPSTPILDVLHTCSHT